MPFSVIFTNSLFLGLFFSQNIDILHNILLMFGCFLGSNVINILPNHRSTRPEVAVGGESHRFQPRYKTY